MDLWIQFSHIGIDGRAAAKLQSKVYNAVNDLYKTVPFDVNQ